MHHPVIRHKAAGLKGHDVTSLNEIHIRTSRDLTLHTGRVLSQLHTCCITAWIIDDEPDVGNFCRRRLYRWRRACTYFLVCELRTALTSAGPPLPNMACPKALAFAKYPAITLAARSQFLLVAQNTITWQRQHQSNHPHHAVHSNSSVSCD